MLIILPPSESKRPPPEQGPPLVLDALSFPALTPLRTRVLEALIDTSAGADAFARLRVRPSRAAEVARNTRLLDVPARPALDVYTGPLHAGLAAAALSSEAEARAARDLIVTSALFGALRASDRIPAYRLDICSRLIGMDRLEPAWRGVLPDVLAAAAGPRGVIVDLRSPGFQAAGMPAGQSERTVVLRVSQRLYPQGRLGDVVAKRVRGQAARLLLESGVDPDEPGELVEVLLERWPARLEAPPGRGKTWTLTISPEA